MIGESNKVLLLKSQIESLPYKEIKPGLRARLSVEMVKDAINLNKIVPEKAKEFADSLIIHCSIPVVIGTPEKKVSPVEDIVIARPFVVSSVKNSARRKGIDYESNTNIRRGMAWKVITTLEKEYKRQNKKYGPFAKYLSNENRNQEMTLEAERLSATRQVLQARESNNVTLDNEFVSRLIETDACNVFFGEELLKWLKSRK